MNAGREAHHGYDEKKESDDGTTAREPDPSGTEQRIRAPPFNAGEDAGGGTLPAPSGIICLCVIAGRHQRAVDPVQLTRALGFDPTAAVTDAQLVLAAKELGLKAKSVRAKWESLPRRSCPVIAEVKGGEFRVGQPVQVKVDTFPFQQYGTLSGTLVWISADAEDKSALSRDIDTRTGAMAASQPQGAERDTNAGFVYRVHIRTGRAQFLVNGQRRSVESGMTVQADILTGRRRVIEFFLSPVIKYLNEGLRVR